MYLKLPDRVDMKVSIITVCFNSGDSIAHTIESIMTQTYKNIEYIIIDGGSKDNTLDVVNRYSEQLNFEIISEPDDGIYDAMNKGLAIASGEVITFLNSDDVFAHQKVVEKAIDVMLKSCNDLVFGDVQFIVDKEVVRLYSSKGFKSWKLRFGWMPPHPGSFAKRELFQRSGGFDTTFKIAADYEMYVRWLLVEDVSFKRVNDVLVHMSLGGISTESWRARLKLNQEIVTACRKHHIYTNLLLVLSKIPFKLLELFIRKNKGKYEVID